MLRMILGYYLLDTGEATFTIDVFRDCRKESRGYRSISVGVGLTTTMGLTSIVELLERLSFVRESILGNFNCL